MYKLFLTTLIALAFIGLGISVAHTFADETKATTTAKAATPAADAEEEVHIGCPACNHPDMDEEDAKTVVLANAAASQPAVATTQKAVDVKNTKCPVTGDDVEDGTFEYQGKIYHVCCPDCEKTFKKDPDKYIKAMAADPAKYGIK